jgi:hypothetical protein
VPRGAGDWRERLDTLRDLIQNEARARQRLGDKWYNAYFKFGMMGRDEFAKIIGELTPRWFLDIRAVPRLDTIAASRLSAFQMFQRAKVSYVDLFGQLGIRSYRSADSNPAVWGNAVTQLLQASGRKGPYLFLFDDESLFQAADDLLPSVIKSAIGKTARFARIGGSRPPSGIQHRT